MSGLWTVIPAAGNSTAFARRGIDIPKHLLHVQYVRHNGPVVTEKEGMMIQHVMAAAPLGSQIVIGTQPQWMADLLTVGEDVQILPIGRTDGQADTVCQILEQIPQDASAVILDCDTVLTRADVEDTARWVRSGEYEVSVAVAVSDDPDMSRVSGVPYPSFFLEKRRISAYGMVSARCVRCVGDLVNALRKHLRDSARLETQPYLSEALNYMGGKKFAHVLRDPWVDWGSPEKIEASGARIVS